MAYEKQVQLKGDSRRFGLAATIKKYTLRDTGFVPTKAGRFQLNRKLNPDEADNRSVRLKITVNQDLTGFKMAVVTANEMQAVNIFKQPDKYATELEQLNFTLQELVDRGALAEC